jgi:hypothetical protein
MKTLVIFSYSRAKLLIECIESVLEANSSSNWKKILVWQQGRPEVEEVVMSHKRSFDLVLVSSGREATTLGNINYNRIFGTDVAFRMFRSELVLGIEEDTIIAKDALDFCSFSFCKYRKHPYFRGVNLGSVEGFDLELSKTYSLIRYATVSQASAITRKTWNKLPLGPLMKNIDEEGWDSRFERVTKTGFMVTPNNSRSMDRGWGGTHAPVDPNHASYVNQRASFVDTHKIAQIHWNRQQIKHHWRNDAIKFRYRDQILFRVRFSKFGDSLAKLIKSIIKTSLFEKLIVGDR